MLAEAFGQSIQTIFSRKKNKQLHCITDKFLALL